MMLKTRMESGSCIRNLTEGNKHYKMDAFCKRLEKKLRNDLPRSTNSTSYYSVIKPFDFLVHPRKQIENLNKMEVGSTYNFTKRIACPTGVESASTRKLMENLHSLGVKVQACNLP